MTTEERRRYFRIDDTVGLSIKLLDQEEDENARSVFAPNAMEIVSHYDAQIRRVLERLEADNPDIAELGSLLNKKLDRLASLVAIESKLVDRIAHRVQQVNISACGLAFSHEDPIAEGSRIEIELTLFPKELKIVSEGIVVACELTTGDQQKYYCRVDFYGMSAEQHEQLIQHIVQSQSSQLRSRRGKP